MDFKEIRKLAQERGIEELRAAEDCIIEGDEPPFPILGEDEGEQLTHVLGAIEILEEIDKGTPLKQAFRNFAQRVRSTLSSS